MLRKGEAMTDTEKQAKERPILFSAPMVRAILSGQKTQTRRVAKLTDGGHVKEVGGHRRWHPSCDNAHQACPYGQPGDRLWVRETFAEEYDYCKHPEAPGTPTEHFHFGWHYRADGEPNQEDMEGFLSDWRPSIHMPRLASRIDLLIKGVRIERLQSIGPEDCLAEGISGYASTGRIDLESCFLELWASINGLESWEANPWVWVVEFERVTQ